MQSVRKPSDFKRIYEQGRVVKAAALRLCYYYRGDQNPSRVAFVASKRVGGAVVRNRVKRLLRESWRRQNPPEQGWDFILVPNMHIVGLSYAEVEETVAHLVDRASRQLKEFK